MWGRFHRRYRQTVRRTSDVADADPGCLDVLGEGVAVAVVVIVVVAAAIFVGIPLLVAVVDLVIVVLLALLGLVARVVLRRPWTVEARAEDGTALDWRVAGWRASGERITEVEQLLAAGVEPAAQAQATERT